MARRGIEFAKETPYTESLIQRARNRLVDSFWESGLSHMMWIDADIMFNPKDVLAMFKAGLDVVGGVYPKKELLWNKGIEYIKKTVAKGEEPTEQGLIYSMGSMCFNPLVDGQGRCKSVLDGEGNTYVCVYDLPTGFMMVSRRAIALLRDAYPETEYQNDFDEKKTTFALYDCFIDKDKRYLSEDWGFSRRWQNIGGEVWAAANCDLGHAGSYCYRGNLFTSGVFSHAPPPETESPVNPSSLRTEVTL